MLTSNSLLRTTLRTKKSSFGADFVGCACRLRVLRAFTLIELLVVIAIISLLVSILLPSLTTAKNIARATTCAVNLRSIGTGLNLAAEDMDGLYPSNFAVSDAWEASHVYHPMKIPSGWPTSLATCRFDDWMTVNDYTDTGLHHCPAMERYLTLYPWHDYQVKLNTLRHYGMAIFGIGGGKEGAATLDRNYQQRITDIPSPAENVAIADSEKIVESATANNTHKLTGANVSSFAGSLSSRHIDMGNYLFMDGHVNRYAPEEISTSGNEENDFHWIYAK